MDSRSPLEMSPAITFDLRLLIRFLYEHALVSSSNWTMASPVTTSRNSRWLDTLLSTGPHMPSFRMCRRASRMGWNVCLTQTSHILQLGFGFTTTIKMGFPCVPCAPQNLTQSPYITPQASDFVTWRNVSLPSIQSMQMSTAGKQ